MPFRDVVVRLFYSTLVFSDCNCCYDSFNIKIAASIDCLVLDSNFPCYILPVKETDIITDIGM